MASGASTEMIETGFRDLDALTGGFRPADLVVIGGRPGAGKSALAVDIARHLAIRAPSPAPVAFFSLGLGKDQIMRRMLCAEARVDHWRMQKGLLRDEERERADRAAAVLRKAPLHVDDTPWLAARELGKKARRLHAEHGLGLILVDSLNLMRGPSVEPGEDRNEEMRRAARSLKVLAAEVGVPVVAIRNLPRKVDRRRNPRPRLSDLGGVEEVADVALLLYRDEIFNPGCPGKEVEAVLAKSRDGRTGMVRIAWGELIAWHLDAGGVGPLAAA